METDGLIVVDEPAGMTAHDVVARVRRLAKTRRVGHGGTLDPMATGVLIIGVNRATRLLTYVIGSGKSYTATIRLGEATVTDDAEGDVTARASTAEVTDEAQQVRPLQSQRARRVRAVAACLMQRRFDQPAFEVGHRAVIPDRLGRSCRSRTRH